MLFSDRAEPGQYVVSFGGTYVARGVYVCYLIGGSYSSVKKLLLLN